MIVKCPECRGRFYTTPSDQQYIRACPLCGGNGLVDTDMVCECGRPVSRVVNKKMICTFLMCEKRAYDKDKANTTSCSEDYNFLCA